MEYQTPRRRLAIHHVLLEIHGGDKHQVGDEMHKETYLALVVETAVHKGEIHEEKEEIQEGTMHTPVVENVIHKEDNDHGTQDILAT